MGQFPGRLLMFVNFNRVFKNKPQTQIAVPSALVDYMNKSLPEGVKYVVDAKGNCVITSERESCTIGGFIFKPTEEQKKVLGKDFTREDVVNYFYNAQESIPLTLKKDGYILLNGQEFPVEKMAYNPLAPIKFVSGSFYMYPPKFPDPFLLKLGCDKYERELLVSRIPNNSISVMEFESSKDEPLYIHYFLNIKIHCLTMNVSFNLKKAKTIRDIVESTSIYNAYVDGKGTLSGQPLDSSLKSEGLKRFDDDSVIFWEKVLEIEEQLGIEFCPPQDDIDFETMCLVEQLYQNLINKVPTLDNQKIDSIDGNWGFESHGKDISESIGRPIFFEFEVASKIELFGVKIELPTLIGVFNAILSAYNTKGEKQKIVLSDENPEKQRYTSMMCFKTESDLNSFKLEDHDKIITLFHNAKRPDEYLQMSQEIDVN